MDHGTVFQHRVRQEYRLQAEAGGSVDAAARGCAGVMMVEPQNGGKRLDSRKYSLGD